MTTSPAVMIERDQRIALADGGFLAADVYRPRDSARVPAVVCALPYLKDGTIGAALWFFMQRYAEAGYAFVLADVGGTGSSSGAARPAFDERDGDEGVALVEWAARQDWCDGKVGMWGASYGALLALRTASRRPPALRAVFAIEGGAQVGAQFLYPNGIRGGMSPLGQWPLGDLVMQLLPPLHARDDADARWKQRLEAMEPRLFAFLRHSAEDETWLRGEVDVEAIETPVYAVGGWSDFLCAASVGLYERLRGPKKLLMGPWAHLMPDQSPVVPVDLLSISLRWWDRWLRDEANGIDTEPPVTAYVLGADEWRSLPAWPPPVRESRLEGDAAGQLGREGSAIATRRLERSVDPSTGYRDQGWGFPLPGLPQDARGDDDRSLTFTGEPLSEPLELAGWPQLRLRPLAVEAGPEWLSAKLSMLDASGASHLITHGAAPVADQGEIEFRLTPTFTRIPAGSRLRLAVAAADFPRYWPQAATRRLAMECGAGGVLLSLPVIADTAAMNKTQVPAHPATTNLAPLALSMRPEWSVHEDLLSGTTTLTLSAGGATWTPQKEVTLDLETRVSAAVSRHAPQQAQVQGRARAVVSRAGAPEITVEASLRVVGRQGQASGRVLVAGEETWRREWSIDGDAA